MHSCFFDVPSIFWAYTFRTLIIKVAMVFSSVLRSTSTQFCFISVFHLSSFFVTLFRTTFIPFSSFLNSWFQYVLAFSIYRSRFRQMSFIGASYETQAKERGFKRHLFDLLLVDRDENAFRRVVLQCGGLQTMQSGLCSTRCTGTSSYMISAVASSTFALI